MSQSLDLNLLRAVTIDVLNDHDIAFTDLHLVGSLAFPEPPLHERSDIDLVCISPSSNMAVDVLNESFTQRYLKYYRKISREIESRGNLNRPVDFTMLKANVRTSVLGFELPSINLLTGEREGEQSLDFTNVTFKRNNDGLFKVLEKYTHRKINDISELRNKSNALHKKHETETVVFM